MLCRAIVYFIVLYRADVARGAPGRAAHVGDRADVACQSTMITATMVTITVSMSLLLLTHIMTYILIVV